MKKTGQHRCGRRLAVSSGDDQNFPTDKEFIVQELGQRTERNALVEQMLEFDVAARHGIADNDKTGPGIEILRVKGLRYGDAKLAKEVRHGRIRGRVRASHVKSAMLEHA